MPSSLDDLAIFAAIAGAGGISAAAARLGVPKSSVSRALGRLEEGLGVELIHRTTRRTRLSTAGEALLERVAPLLSGLEAAVSELPDRESQPAGLLRVTCTIDFGATVVAELVTRFVARHPDVVVEVHASNTIVDLIAGGFDIAFRFSPRRRMSDSALVARRLGSLQPQLVASPAYCARRGTPRTPRELDGHDFITYTGAESFVIETPGHVQRVAAKGHIRCDDMFFALAAARAGGGIALLPSFLADESIAAGELLPVMPHWRVQSGTIWLVHPAARNLPVKVSAFRDFVIAEFRRRVA
jgi:DNA-binding transcriptional LysR family regulator